jgi:Tol biopolymer transport system component
MRSDGEQAEIWLLDVARGSGSRFAFGKGNSILPVWSPDGRRIVFESDREGLWNLYVKSVAGGEEERLLPTGVTFRHPRAWSPDGRFVLYDELSRGTGFDIWQLPLDGDRTPRPVLQTRFEEQRGVLSPDQRWIAYVSNETGRQEVYLQSFPDAEVRQQVSTGGGTMPAFRADQRELIYGAPNFVAMSVPIQLSQELRVGTPRPLFRLPVGYSGSLEATPDFQRFLVRAPSGEPELSELRVVLDWPALARERP